MKHRLLYLVLALAVLQHTTAQDDVTTLYVNNPGFDEAYDYTTTTTGDLPSGTIKSVSGWTKSTSDWSIGGTFQFGTAATFNGARYTIPAAGFQNSSGGCLALNAGWSATLAYTQQVTLPAGTYDLVYAVNNRNSIALGSNRFGFIPTTGTAIYSQQNTFKVSSWITDTVTIKLSTQTTGHISVGYVAVGNYSYNNAALCIDFVKLIKYDALTALKKDLSEQRALAVIKAAATDVPGCYNGVALQAAITLADSANREDVTEADVQAAIAALTSAIEAATAIVSAYTPLKSAIKEAQLYANHTNYAGKEAFLAAIAAAQAVYDSPDDQRQIIASTLSSLKEATKTYRSARPSEWVTIKNGALWKDNTGKAVQAHGAGFLQVGDTWYMIGEDRTNTWNPDVNMYSTTDFVNWKFERKIIKNGVTHPDLGSSRMIERPKLLYCANTGQFVVWCHWEAGNYGASEAGVFYSNVVNGPYTYQWSGRPNGIKSRDCNVFQDADGKAYFVSTTDENQNLTLFELSDNYLDVVKSTRLETFNGKAREAPAIVNVKGRYFLISSLCTGWDPNQATISHSSALETGWVSQSNLGNSISFDTQAASILVIKGTKDTTYLYVGDRWQDPNLYESKTIMFPIEFIGTTCVFNYRQQFDINLATGEWRETTTTNRIAKENWRIHTYSSQETSSENTPATNAIDGNLSTIWHTKYSGTAAIAPHSIEIDMGASYEVSGFLATPRIKSSSSNGLIREFLFYTSQNGTDWSVVAGGSWLPYCSEVYFPAKAARYVRLVALSGTYASLAEIDLLTNTPVYTAATISPYYKKGAGSWASSNTLSVTEGTSLTFGPNLSGAVGSWAICGPNSHQDGVREYTIDTVSTNDLGTFTSLFLNAYNQTSKTAYALTVVSDLAQQTTSKRAIAQTFFTLQGMVVPNPPLKGLYLVKIEYDDGSVKVEKHLH